MLFYSADLTANFKFPFVCISLLAVQRLLLGGLKGFFFPHMSHSNRSLPVSPHWLRDEANRLAQTAAPEEQELAVKLMTPLMSDSNQHVRFVQFQIHFDADEPRSRHLHLARALLHHLSRSSAWRT